MWRLPPGLPSVIDVEPSRRLLVVLDPHSDSKLLYRLYSNVQGEGRSVM